MLFDPKETEAKVAMETVMTGGLTPKAAPNYPRSYCVRAKKGLQPIPLFPAFVAVLGHMELAPNPLLRFSPRARLARSSGDVFILTLTRGGRGRFRSLA